MRTISLLAALITFSGSVSAKCSGHAVLTVYNDSSAAVMYNNQTSQQPVQAYFTPPDWAELRIMGDLWCNSTFFLTRNSDTLLSGLMPYTPYTLALTDTGHYFLHYTSITADWTWEFSIENFVSTGLPAQEEADQLVVFPSPTEGLFSIQSSRQLKRLIVVDESGRSVIESTVNFSEINLTDFSSGIYFYSIIDDREKVWRGKLLKN